MPPCLLFIYRFYLTTKIENASIIYCASYAIALTLLKAEQREDK